GRADACGDHRQERRLARAVGSQEAEDLAFRDVEGHAADDLAAVVLTPEIAQDDRRADGPQLWPRLFGDNEGTNGGLHRLWSLICNNRRVGRLRRRRLSYVGRRSAEHLIPFSAAARERPLHDDAATLEVAVAGGAVEIEDAGLDASEQFEIQRPFVDGSDNGF